MPTSCSLFLSYLVAKPNHTVMDVQRTDWIIAELCTKTIQSNCLNLGTKGVNHSASEMKFAIFLFIYFFYSSGSSKSSASNFSLSCCSGICTGYLVYFLHNFLLLFSFKHASFTSLIHSLIIPASEKGFLCLLKDHSALSEASIVHRCCFADSFILPVAGYHEFSWFSFVVLTIVLRV